MPSKRRTPSRWPLVAAVAALAAPPALWIINALLPGPRHLGGPGRPLAPCPDSPNCVSSQATEADARHHIQPLLYQGPMADAQGLLRSVLADMPGARLVEDRPLYLRYEFRSTIFRFVDDVEFLLDPDSTRIEVRSASRLGYSDLGANRRRIEAVRTRFNAGSQQLGRGV